VSEQKRLIPDLPPEGSMKAVLGTLAWQNLIRYSEAFPPQSITIEVKHGEYVYRGTAYLVDDGKETAVPVSVAPPSQGECEECDGPCRWEYADRYGEENES